jgi:predicted RNase H-like HicB family nuclease
MAILTTSLFGIFTSYYLSKRYLNNNLGKLQDEFFNDYEEILDKFKEKLSFSSKFYIMNRVISSDLFDKLKYIRNNFIEISNNYNVSSRKPIYLCRLLIKEPVVNFDRDIYTEKIITKLFINSTEDIVTFGESPEDANNNCNSIIEHLKNKLTNYDELLEKESILESVLIFKKSNSIISFLNEVIEVGELIEKNDKKIGRKHWAHSSGFVMGMFIDLFKLNFVKSELTYHYFKPNFLTEVFLWRWNMGKDIKIYN